MLLQCALITNVTGKSLNNDKDRVSICTKLSSLVKMYWLRDVLC